MKKLFIWNKNLSLLISIFILSQCGLFAVSANESISVDIPIENIEGTENSIFSYVSSSMGDYYSDYSSSSYYMNTVTGEDIINYLFWWEEVNTYADDGLQLRSNCYGYAFRFFYAPKTFSDNLSLPTISGIPFQSYKQQPGEFANKSSGLQINISASEYRTIYNYNDLLNLHDDIFYGDYTNTQRMNVMQQLLQADATTLGYTVSEMTTTTIPNAQNYSNKRLIALVVGEGGYHFYMQHSDNSWSHKEGSSAPSNKCIDCGLTLSNSNIRDHSCEGDYDYGIVKFFYITKNAVVDYKHMDGCLETSIKTSILSSDGVGNQTCSADCISSIPEDYIFGQIDYVGDIDYYNFYVDESDDYNLTVDAGGIYEIGILIYDSSGNLVTSRETYSGSIRFSVFLSSSDDYYIGFYAVDQTVYAYNTVNYTWY